MAKAKLTTLTQGGVPTFVGSWDDDKPGASEGAVLNVINSGYFPMLTEEKWVCHDGMWVFVPPSGTLL